MQSLRSGFLAVMLTGLTLMLVASCTPEIPEGQDAELRAMLEKLQVSRDSLDAIIAGIEKALKSDSTDADVRVVPVKTTMLEPTKLEHYVDVLGNVTSDRNVMVSPRQSGIVTQVYVKEGDRVSEGKPLAQLDASLLERQLKETETQLEFAQTVFEKRKRVWEQKVGSEIEYLSAKNDVSTLERRIETLKQQIGDMTIRAPFAGMVDMVQLRVGEAASPGMPSFQVVSLQGLQIQSAISERFRSYLRKGDPVEIYFPHLDLDTIRTKIAAISEAIDASDRTFEVFVRADGISSSIRPNMTCRMRLNDRTLDSVLVAPINAIQRFKDEQFVYVAKMKGDNYVAERRVVETGLSYDANIEVSRGLQAGEKLVTVGFQNLADGVLVDPQ